MTPLIPRLGLFALTACSVEISSREAEPEPRWRCDFEDQQGYGDVVVCRDAETGTCHAAWRDSRGAASLGQVPCAQGPHATGGGL